MNIKLPTRFEEDYIKFEKYEYTHCFTYELARRNSNVEDLLNLLFELFTYYDQIVLPTLIKYEKITITDDMLGAIKNVENIYKEFLIGLVSHYKKKEFLNNFKNLTFSNIKEKISYLVNTLAKELYDKYYIIYQLDKSDRFNNDFHEIYNPLTYLERDKALTEHIENVYADNTILQDYYRFNANENKYFTIFQDIHKHQEEFSFSTIYPNFKMGIRDFTDTKIILNLNLSKNEIFDYIEKIKESTIMKTGENLNQTPN